MAAGNALFLIDLLALTLKRRPVSCVRWQDSIPLLQLYLLFFCNFFGNVLVMGQGSNFGAFWDFVVKPHQVVGWGFWLFLTDFWVVLAHTHLGCGAWATSVGFGGTEPGQRSRKMGRVPSQTKSPFLRKTRPTYASCTWCRYWGLLWEGLGTIPTLTGIT